MSFAFVIMCDGPNCGETAPASPVIGGYRRWLARRGWASPRGQRAPRGADYCPKHADLSTVMGTVR